MSARLTVQETADFLRTLDGVLILTHVRPDGDTVGCAAALCKAALQAASLNVFINTKLMTDKTHAAALDAQADALLSEYVPKADTVFAQVTKQLRT